jgi:hypothetical protein
MSLLSDISKALRLERTRLRRVVGATVIAIAIVLLLASTFVDKLSLQAGIAVGVVAILFFTTLVLDGVATVKSENEIQIYRDEDDALSAQLEYIRTQRPKRVRMFEYSGYMIASLLKELSDSSGTKSVKLLLFDPRKATEWHSRYRILPVIASLPITFGEREDIDLQVRCYSTPASLRGRNYDERVIVAGWYTYDRRDGQPDEAQLWGGHNAVVMTPCDNSSGAALRATFNRAFDAIWRYATPLTDVVASYSEVKSYMEPAWLERVSGVASADNERHSGEAGEQPPTGQAGEGSVSANHSEAVANEHDRASDSRDVIETEAAVHRPE